jgi:hypothetical protein
MLRVVETTADEHLRLLESENFGHLGCAQDNQPYVLPMHFAFDGENILFLTTVGMKTEWLDDNPKVCFQIEKMTDERRWQSVVVLGRAERLVNAEEMGRAGDFIFKKHPSLTPALNKTIVQGEERPGRAAIYRIRPISITGRKTTKQ